MKLSKNKIRQLLKVKNQSQKRCKKTNLSNRGKSARRRRPLNLRNKTLRGGGLTTSRPAEAKEDGNVLVQLEGQKVELFNKLYKDLEILIELLGMLNTTFNLKTGVHVADFKDLLKRISKIKNEKQVSREDELFISTLKDELFTDNENVVNENKFDIVHEDFKNVLKNLEEYNRLITIPELKSKNLEEIKKTSELFLILNNPNYNIKKICQDYNKIKLNRIITHAKDFVSKPYDLGMAILEFFNNSTKFDYSGLLDSCESYLSFLLNSRDITFDNPVKEQSTEEILQELSGVEPEANDPLLDNPARPGAEAVVAEPLAGQPLAVQPLAVPLAEPLVAQPLEAQPLAVEQGQPLAVPLAEPLVAQPLEAQPLAVEQEVGEPLAQPLAQPLAVQEVAQPLAVQEQVAAVQEEQAQPLAVQEQVAAVQVEPLAQPLAVEEVGEPLAVQEQVAAVQEEQAQPLAVKEEEVAQSLAVPLAVPLEEPLAVAEQEEQRQPLAQPLAVQEEQAQPLAQPVAVQEAQPRGANDVEERQFLNTLVDKISSLNADIEKINVEKEKLTDELNLTKEATTSVYNTATEQATKINALEANLTELDQQKTNLQRNEELLSRELADRENLLNESIQLHEAEKEKLTAQVARQAQNILDLQENITNLLQSDVQNNLSAEQLAELNTARTDMTELRRELELVQEENINQQQLILENKGIQNVVQRLQETINELEQNPQMTPAQVERVTALQSNVDALQSDLATTRRMLEYTETQREAQGEEAMQYINAQQAIIQKLQDTISELEQNQQMTPIQLQEVTKLRDNVDLLSKTLTSNTPAGRGSEYPSLASNPSVLSRTGPSAEPSAGPSAGPSARQEFLVRIKYPVPGSSEHVMTQSGDIGTSVEANVMNITDELNVGAYVNKAEAEAEAEAVASEVYVNEAEAEALPDYSLPDFDPNINNPLPPPPPPSPFSGEPRQSLYPSNRGGEKTKTYTRRMSGTRRRSDTRQRSGKSPSKSTRKNKLLAQLFTAEEFINF